MPARKNNSAAKILVVEDEPDIAKVLAHVLAQEGFRVNVAATGQEAVDEVHRKPPDLMILDLMLPDFNGFEVLKMLRDSNGFIKMGVIVLTARTDEIDRVLAFELGADDYVMKPFSPRELVLRVRAVLKRAVAGRPAPAGVISMGPIEIDVENHQAFISGDPIRLTLTEFRLLADLVRAGGRVRTREALLSELWDYDSDVMSRTVDTHIRRLRTKLGGASAWLATVRGVGYRLKDPSADL
jgi:two-component system phosphate regulon response regulator PhoB